MRLLNSLRKIFKKSSYKGNEFRKIPKEINIRRFYDNLLTTKHYCEQQIIKFPKKEPSTILRSFNPEVNNKSIFEFKTVTLFEETNLLAFWSQEPLDADLTLDLFFKQLEEKNKLVEWNKSHDDFKGEIIVIDYEATVLDGASEWESKGLFDVYDLPPIDTWIYMARNKEGRRDLYAWIPEPFIELCQGAIDVNCLDLIHFVTW